MIADRLVDHAKELGVPLFVGEWGNLTNNDKIFSQDPVPATRELVSRLEAAGASHSFWYYHNDMDTQPWFVEFLQRPYPRALAGKLVSYSFHADTDAFECE